jgi:hypothetical protein
MSDALFVALPFYREPITPKLIISSTYHSSQRYGVCERCSKFASEVFYGRTQLPFVRPDGTHGRTVGPSLFGHRQCVIQSLKTSLNKRGIEPVIEVKTRHCQT